MAAAREYESGVFVQKKRTRIVALTEIVYQCISHHNHMAKTSRILDID
jgi:hypothetical protein